MTPEQNAKELTRKFFDIDFFENDKKHYCIEWLNAKKCALICVNEILIELEDDNDGYRMDRVEYWEEVKQEINKL